jgi:hypothetical protein
MGHVFPEGGSVSQTRLKLVTIIPILADLKLLDLQYAN